MKDTMVGEELVARWRNGGEQNPAGPLFVAGEYAEVDMTNGCMCQYTVGTNCTGSGICYCC